MGALDGQVVLITGAARGQGRSHAVTFAAEGADLILLDICRDLDRSAYELGTAAQLDVTAGRCRAHGRRVVTLDCDVRDPAAVDGAVAVGLEELGRIDVLIANAGITSPTGAAHDLEVEGWRLVIDVNLHGVWHCGRAVVRHMIERGGGGCIINISSTAGLKAFLANAAYVASKHAVIGLTRSMALDLGPRGIRVNAVCPGAVRDDPELDGRMLSAVADAWELPRETYEEAFKDYHLLPTLVEAADISRACLWLASDAGARVTGIALPVDAGMLTK